MIIFGTYFGGKVKKVNNQWLETKYLLIMVPLVPLTTMFVTSSDWNKRNGFEVAINGKSAGHGYLRFFCFIFTLVFWGTSLFIGGYSSFLSNFPIPFSILGGITAMLYAWSYFEHVNASENEMVDRKLLGSIVGLNALPEWMPNNIKNELTEKLKQQVVDEFGDDNIDEHITQHGLTNKRTALLYAYLRYKVVAFNATQKNVEQLEKVKNKFINALQKNETAALQNIYNQMPDDFTDDASKEIAQ